MSRQRKPVEIERGYQPNASSYSGLQTYGYQAKTRPEDVQLTNKELHDIAADVFKLNPSSENESSSDTSPE